MALSARKILAAHSTSVRVLPAAVGRTLEPAVLSPAGRAGRLTRTLRQTLEQRGSELVDTAS